MSPALLVIGVFVVICGLFLLWTATYGIDWNSTHNRGLQRIPRVSPRQERLNTIGGRVGGPIVIAFGVLIIVASFIPSTRR